ncbi:hypothetical protein OJJOAM_002438 [Cupriavidus sp. H18C1]
MTFAIPAMPVRRPSSAAPLDCPAPSSSRRPLARRLAALACGVAMLTPLAHAQSQTQQRLPVVSLSAGMYVIRAEVAADPQSRQQGLMYRKSMPANTGMLFVFEQKAGHCFWMKNTELPLSIAFLADDGTIVNIEDMQPRERAEPLPEGGDPLCAGDEPGVVRAEGHQGRREDRRPARAVKGRTIEPKNTAL